MRLLAVCLPISLCTDCVDVQNKLNVNRIVSMHNPGSLVALG